jgi:hypothetical protein
MAVVENGVTVACNDDACSDHSIVDWTAHASADSVITVGDYWGDHDPFAFSLTAPRAAQDDCATAPSLAAGVHWILLQNASADGASACDLGTEPDVYFAYTAPSSGTLRVSTCGTDDGRFFDAGENTLLSLHPSCPATAANTLACNDDASPTCASDPGQPADAAVALAVVAGQTILIRVTRAGPQTSILPIRLEIALDPGTVICAGDGTAAACPCANFGAPLHGCANSAVHGGASLSAAGFAYMSSDTLSLEALGTPASAPVMYLQGLASIAGGNGAVFGDGLRCVTSSVIRLGVRTSSGGVSAFGAADGTGAQISVNGQIPAAGGARVYQAWYRDAASFCTSNLFNLTNGLSLTWIP